LAPERRALFVPARDFRVYRADEKLAIARLGTRVAI